SCSCRTWSPNSTPRARPACVPCWSTACRTTPSRETRRPPMAIRGSPVSTRSTRCAEVTAMPHRPGRTLLALLLCLLVSGVAAAMPPADDGRSLIDAAVDAMPRADGDTPALYVLGVAGDASENVFRNEVRFLT